MENIMESINRVQDSTIEVIIERIEKRKVNYLEYQNRYDDELSQFAKGYVEGLTDIIEIIK